MAVFAAQISRLHHVNAGTNVNITKKSYRTIRPPHFADLIAQQFLSKKSHSNRHRAVQKVYPIKTSSPHVAILPKHVLKNLVFKIIRLIFYGISACFASKNIFCVCFSPTSPLAPELDQVYASQAQILFVIFSRLNSKANFIIILKSVFRAFLQFSANCFT